MIGFWCVGDCGFLFWLGVYVVDFFVRVVEVGYLVLDVVFECVY